MSLAWARAIFLVDKGPMQYSAPARRQGDLLSNDMFREGLCIVVSDEREGISLE